MNKIEELAKQAGWNDWTDDDNWIHPYYQERGYLTLNDLEQFAELIVKECVRSIGDGDGSMSSMDEHIWREVCQDEIKKHFGIKL